MQLALYSGHAPDHPDLTVLLAILANAGLPYVTLNDRPPGEIHIIPCIAALDDVGKARKSWGANENTSDLQSWSGADGAPQVVKTYRPLSRYEFRQLFTFDERVAVDNSEDARVRTMRSDLNSLGPDERVHHDNPQITGGVALLEGLGLIGAGRADEILSAWPTE